MTAIWWGMAPLLAPTAALAALLIARRPRAVLRIAQVQALGLWALVAVVAVHPPLSWDAFARWYALLVLSLGGLGLWASTHYMAAEAALGRVRPERLRPYFLLFTAFVLSLLGVAAVENYLLMWAAVEGTTLSTVVLVAFPGGERPIEAAWKYVVVTGIGGLLALLGTVLVMHGAGLPLGAWGLAAPGPVAGTARTVAVRAGLVLALVGFGSKAGLVPFHTWLPDAHSEAPAPVSALLSAVKLAGGLYALLRLVGVASLATGPAWPHALLVIVGLLSLATAAAAIPGQRDLKRMYAYSSIEHMGVIALGAGFGGIALLGALLHMWTHALGKTALFFSAGHVRLRVGATSPPAATGLLAAMPFTGTALVLGTAVIAGLPPFGLFWSEWLVMRGGVAAGQTVWVAVALGFLLISMLGFALRLPQLLMGRPAAAGRGRNGPESTPEPHAHGADAAVETPGALWPVSLVLAGALAAGIALPAAMHGTWLGAAAALAAGGAR